MKQHFGVAVALSLTLTPALAASVPVAGAAQPPTSIENARIEPASGTSPSQALAAAARGKDVQWIGWSFPALPSVGDVCCFTKSFNRSSCSLGDKDWSWGTSDKAKRTTTELFVLVKTDKGRLAGIRIVSPYCEVDGAGRRLTWLGAVEPVASLAALERLMEEGSREDVGESALTAIAYHADPRADALIERRALDRSVGEEDRKQALFWAGQARGEAGFRLIDRVLGSESDPDIREHCLFALTQSAMPAAIDRVKRAAVEDRDGEVRSQALFWLAQSGTPGAGEWIVERLDVERDSEVREQAVFALSQMDDGTDWLLKVLRSKRDPETVRQALFWLGQSDDPRALTEIEKILER